MIIVRNFIRRLEREESIKIERYNIHENVYSYGDFCWVDFESLEALDELEAHEMAELFYLGHLKKPVSRPFFEKLNNQYVYLAHDDGWGNKTYFKEKNDCYKMISHLFPTKLQTYKKRNVQPLNFERSNL